MKGASDEDKYAHRLPDAASAQRETVGWFPGQRGNTQVPLIHGSRVEEKHLAVL